MSQTTSAAPSPTISTVELTRIASQIRRDIVRQVHGVQSGHPGGSLGCADFFTALYFKILKHSPQPWDMDGKDQDLFFLSNGHISPVFYVCTGTQRVFPGEGTGHIPEDQQPFARAPYHP
jgi:transketolase